MEKEICRRETSKKIKTIFTVIAWFLVGFGALCWLTVLGVTATNDAWEVMFVDGSYLIPIFIGLSSCALALIFFVIERMVSDVSMSLVLTNKRIYGQVAVAKINQLESYNLNAITYYSLNQKTVKGKTNYILIFKTATDTARYVVDQEFYNEFVNAVNGAV